MEHAFLTLFHSVVHALSPEHYFGFFIAFFAWVLLAIITYALRGNNLVLTLLSILTFLLFFAAPFISFIVVENTAKNSEIINPQTKQLQYIDKVVIKGDLLNRSRRSLKECRILTYGVPSTGNAIADLKAYKKSFRFAILSLDKVLGKGESESIYITLDGISDMNAYSIHTFTLCK